ncbi:AAA-type ATPase family protein [Actinidia rufa]|uniref:AAA-type ATPase family protein n=1 Tax=Actinidia rufa TaxID=165716 RepID=A0A7J0EJ30_9ERIC|nr:AAA-type ATPase family protein [Actinidia rufa]
MHPTMRWSIGIGWKKWVDPHPANLNVPPHGGVHLGCNMGDKQQKMAEEQRNLVQQQAQAKTQMLRFEDELARKRMQTDHEAQRRHNAELVRMQEESSIRKEQARRATEEQIHAQQRQTEKERAEIERGIRVLLTDRNKLLMTVGGVTALAAGVYTTRAQPSEEIHHHLCRAQQGYLGHSQTL